LKYEIKHVALVLALAAAVLLIAAPASAARGNGNTGFDFNATDISGFPTGAARLTGGDAYDPGTGFVKSAGGIACTAGDRRGGTAVSAS